MAWLKGPRRRSYVAVDEPVLFQKDVILPQDYVYKRFYVSQLNGSSGNDGESWEGAVDTIQAAVDLANIPLYATRNVDILVGNGLYEETVEITRAGTELTSTAMLWQNMGSNCGYIGKLRIIGDSGVYGRGYNKWTCGAAAMQPNLYIGRPNVEIHGFNIQEDSSETTTAGLWGLDTTYDEMAGHAQISMPAILCEDQYNNAALLNGAGNNVLINNCRINSAGILNSGAKWVDVTNCILEYGEYGVAIIANSKGTPSESHVNNCLFSQKTYDIVHGNAITCWVDNVRFASASTTHLFPLAAHAASAYCWISNSIGNTMNIWNGTDNAKNAGWGASNCYCTDEGEFSNAAINTKSNNKP